MPRLTKKPTSNMKSGAAGKKVSAALNTKTERRPGLKTSLLARDVNEFLHAPKATKKEKRETAQAEVLERAKTSSLLSSLNATAKLGGKVNKDGASTQQQQKRKAEKQKRKREAQAKTFNSSVQGLLSGLPDLDELQKDTAEKRQKQEARGIVRVKEREQVIKMDKMAFQRNMAKMVAGNGEDSKAGEMVMVGDKITSAGSPLARLGAIRQQLAKSMGKEPTAGAMEVEK